MKFSFMKKKILPINFMGENSMHKVVYSPTIHGNFWGEEIMPGAVILHGNIIFMHNNFTIFSCMKLIGMGIFPENCALTPLNNSVYE